jgi:hypothetical protein
MSPLKVLVAILNIYCTEFGIPVALTVEDWIHYHFCLVVSGINTAVLIEIYWLYCVLCLIQCTWINMSRM